MEGTKRTREGGVRNHGVPHKQMALLWASFRGLPFVPTAFGLTYATPSDP